MRYSWHNSPLRARACQPIADLTSICPQRDLKDHPASLGCRMVSMSSIPAAIGFLGINCHCKSIGTQIPHDGGLAPISPIGDRTSTESCRMISKHYALNRLTTRYKGGVVFVLKVLVSNSFSVCRKRLERSDDNCYRVLTYECREKM